MPAIINVAANLIFGAAFALGTRTSPALKREMVSWPLMLLVAFEALIVTPMATYLFRFYPHWSMLYGFDPQIYPTLAQWTGWLTAAAVLLNSAAAWLGFAIARVGILAERAWLWSLPWAAGLVVIAVVAVLYGKRVLFIGNYDAFWQGSAELFVHRTPGRIGLGVYGLGVVYLLWVHSRFSHHEPPSL